MTLLGALHFQRIRRAGFLRKRSCPWREACPDQQLRPSGVMNMFGAYRIILIIIFVWALFPAHAADETKGSPIKQRRGSATFGKEGFAMRAEQGILQFTNEMRRERNLAPLGSSPALRFLASTQSSLMCKNRVLEHESEKFPSPWRRFTSRLKIAGVKSGAENIAYRTITPAPLNWAKEIVNGWMNSPEHKKNILDPRLRYVGIGVRPCQNNVAYATQVFSPEPGRDPRARE